MPRDTREKSHRERERERERERDAHTHTHTHTHAHKQDARVRQAWHGRLTFRHAKAATFVCMHGDNHHCPERGKRRHVVTRSWDTYSTSPGRRGQEEGSWCARCKRAPRVAFVKVHELDLNFTENAFIPWQCSNQPKKVFGVGQSKESWRALGDSIWGEHPAA